MGLDMCLEKFPRYKNATAKDVYAIESYLGWKGTKNEKKYSLKEWCGINEKDIRPDFLKFYTPHFKTRYYVWDTGHKYGRNYIKQEIGYWRKANSIHNWFVENVQNGVDDCGSYEVDEYQLQELLDICKEVQLKAIQMVAPVKNGETWHNGEVTINYEEGTKILNSDEIEELLPTCSGFFFGSTDYDSYYLQDIADTIEIIEKVLDETDFEKEAVIYTSSW